MIAIKNSASRLHERAIGLAIGVRPVSRLQRLPPLDGKWNSSRLTELAHKILDGFDYRQMKRLGDDTVSGEPNAGKTFTQHNQEIETKQQEWLKKKGLE